MGKDYLKSGSPQFEARQRRHRHNGLHGSLRRAQMFVDDVLSLDSTTEEAKTIAVRLEQDLESLATALKVRKDIP